MRQPKRTTDELVAFIREYARRPRNYERGWDIIVEATDDAELRELLGSATTERGALWKVGNYVNLRHEHRREIESTAF